MIFIMCGMDTFDKIKISLVQGSGRCVVLQNNDPRYIVMTWQEYEKFVKMIDKSEINKTIDIKDIPV